MAGFVIFCVLGMELRVLGYYSTTELYLAQMNSNVCGATLLTVGHWPVHCEMFTSTHPLGCM